MRRPEGRERSAALARLAIATILCALIVTLPGMTRTADEPCGGTTGLDESFRAHVKSFNTPRDVETMLAYEEDLVELGHTATDFVDFSAMSPEEHRRRVAAGTAKTEIYSWAPSSLNTRTFGSTGLVWGTYLRKHKPVGGALSEAEGVFTATYVCSEGRWRSVLWHREPRPMRTR